MLLMLFARHFSKHLSEPCHVMSHDTPQGGYSRPHFPGGARDLPPAMQAASRLTVRGPKPGAATGTFSLLPGISWVPPPLSSLGARSHGAMLSFTATTQDDKDRQRRKRHRLERQARVSGSRTELASESEGPGFESHPCNFWEITSHIGTSVSLSIQRSRS